MIDRVTVPEAAKQLNITEGAIRQRIHRGTLRSDKDTDGRVYVYVTPEDVENITGMPAEDDCNDTPLYDELKDRIRFLEGELEGRKEESRRKDTIIAQMNQSLASLINRVPQLESSSEAAESSLSHSNGEGKGVVPPEPQKGFWRRIFGQ